MKANNNEIKVKYTRSNVSDEASSKILAAALKPVFEKFEEEYAETQHKAEKENSG